MAVPDPSFGMPNEGVSTPHYGLMFVAQFLPRPVKLKKANFDPQLAHRQNGQRSCERLLPIAIWGS
jgi:hypothetical protein